MHLSLSLSLRSGTQYPSKPHQIHLQKPSYFIRNALMVSIFHSNRSLRTITDSSSRSGNRAEQSLSTYVRPIRAGLKPHTSQYPWRTRPSPFALLIALRSNRCVTLQKPINLPVVAVGLAMVNQLPMANLLLCFQNQLSWSIHVCTCVYMVFKK